MAVNTAPEASYRLPCGEDAERLWEAVSEGRSRAHPDGCVDCDRAAGGLRSLIEATPALAEDQAEPPARLVGSVMAAVRSEVRRRHTLPLPPDGEEDLGSAMVAESAVAAVLRFAADQVPGVRARSCRVTTHPTRPGAVTVRMTLALRYAPLPEDTFTRVRTTVRQALEAQVGLRATTIDLEVVDVWTGQL